MKHGESVRTRVFQLRHLKRHEGEFKAAVVVSKKVSKSAPLRNRIRRRVYEQLRTNFKIKDDTSLIISVFHKDVATMPAKKLEEQLQELLVKAGLLQ